MTTKVTVPPLHGATMDGMALAVVPLPISVPLCTTVTVIVPLVRVAPLLALTTDVVAD